MATIDGTPLASTSTTTLPVDPDHAFSYVSNPANWPHFFPGVRSTRVVDQWSGVGGRVQVSMEFFGRSYTAEFELTEWHPPHAFRYTARQDGRPDLDSRRTFSVTGSGTRFTATTELDRRQGLPGLLDRVSLRFTQRAQRRALARLASTISVS